MYNDYEALKLHKARERDLLREAQNHRLAMIARGPRKSVNEQVRAILTSINTKLDFRPANRSLDCVLLPSAC